MNRTTLTQTWRRFSFFEREWVKDPEDADSPFAGFQDLDILKCLSGRGGTLFVGEKDGGVHHMLNNKDWESNYFKAYAVSLYDFTFFAEKNLLIAAGEDAAGISPLLKIWNFDKMDKNDVPFCIRCVKVGPGNKATKVTCLTVDKSGFVLAVGFADSSVAIYRGDISKDKQSKAQIMRDGLAEEGAVVALAFYYTDALEKSSVALYIGTNHVIATYNVCMKDKEAKQINLYRETCSPKCWALTDRQMLGQFVVARRDGVYFYQHDSKGGMQLFEGEKVLMKTVANYLLIVYRDVNATEFEQKEKMNMLTIYDMVNIYIAYSAPVPQVAEIFYQWGSFYVITSSGQLLHLIEKDNRSKLDILFRKNLYDLAVKLAESCNFKGESLSDVYTRYGDFLYAKNDYQNAVRQYIKTIGCVEPSTIIRKFLDSQHIEQLTLYLEALHKTEYANHDHTTILLNCYTKMSDSEKIDKFVKAKDQEESSDSSASCDYYFNAEAGIKVLKESGYVDQALVLAKKHNLLDLRIKMLIEDKREFSEAIRCLTSADFAAALENLKKYGRILAVEVPVETLELTKELCTGHKGQADCAVKPDDLYEIFLQNPPYLQKFLEFAVDTEAIRSAASPALFHTLLELYLRNAAGHFDTFDKEECDKVAKFLERNFKKFEFDKALILCRTYNFDRGLLFLYEKAELPHEVLRHFIAKNDFHNVVQTCQTYGKHKSNKDMWIEALWFFARATNPPELILKQLLVNIEKFHILPPLMVLEILSHSTTITLGFIKDYLLGWLKEEDESAQKFQRQMAYYQQEIDKNSAIIDDLSKNPQIFQVSKCSACDAPLEAPTVHFLCKHSYHQHCFESYADNDNECPACLPENKKLRACFSGQDQVRDLYHQLKTDLLDSTDAITTVADYIGKGVFHKKSEVADQIKPALTSISAVKTPKNVDSSNPFVDVSKNSSSKTSPSLNPFVDDENDD